MTDNEVKNGKKFNKGEWSEFYAFIKILCDKKIHLLDSDLNTLDSFYKVVKIIRKEIHPSTYNIGDFEIVKNTIHKSVKIEVETLKPYIKTFLKSLKQGIGSSFFIKDIDGVFDLVHSNTVKVGSSWDKSDIHLVIDDKNLFNKKMGFNIKSYIGNPPTLLNASKATNFIYEIIGFNGTIETVNRINTKHKIRDRILYALNHSKSIKFIGLDNSVFKNT